MNQSRVEIEGVPVSSDTAARPRRSRWSIVLLATLAVFVVAGAIASWLAYNDRASATDLRVRTDGLRAQSADAAAAETSDISAETDISTADSAAWDALGAWSQDYGAAEDPWNRWSDVIDQSVNLHNQGSTTAATAKLNTDGTSTLAEFEQKATALDQSLTQLQTAVSQLKEADRG